MQCIKHLQLASAPAQEGHARWCTNEMARRWAKYLMSIILVLVSLTSYLRGQTAPSSGRAAAQGLLTVSPPAATAPREPNLSFGFSQGVGRGDFVGIHVTIGTHEYLFEVDTGSPISLIDSAAAATDRGSFKLLGGAGGDRAISGKDIIARRCEAPNLIAGGKRLRNTNGVIEECDLTPSREATGRPIEGVLGMDVLGNYVVHLDFQGRKLELIDPDVFRPPTGEGEIEVPLENVEHRAPGLAISVGGQSNVLVRLDTGNNGSFSFTESLLRKVVGSDPEVQGIWYVDLSGVVHSHATLIPQKWTWEGVIYQHVWAGLSVAQNWMGLAALCNYDVICDFSRQRAYLRPLRGVAPPESKPDDLGIVIRSGRFLVIGAGEQAIKCDLHVGDEIVTVAKKPVKGLEMWQTMDLADPKGPLVFSVLREGVVHDVTLPR